MEISLSVQEFPLTTLGFYRRLDLAFKIADVKQREDAMNAKGRRLLGIALGLILGVASARGDEISLSGATTVTAGNSGQYEVTDFPFTSWIISQGWTEPNNTTIDPFILSISVPSIPTGSRLVSAVLSLPAPVPSVSVAESVSHNYVGPVCFWFFCFGWDNAADAAFSPAAQVTFTQITAGNSSISPNFSGGTLDLLALGLGAAVAAGNGVTVDGMAQLSVESGSADVVHHGWNTYTVFDVGAQANWGISGVVTVDYTSAPPPTPTPEPGTLGLLGAGLLGLGSVLRRRLAGKSGQTSR